MEDSREIQAGRLTIRSRRDGDTHVLDLAGEFDLGAEAEFDREMRRVEREDATAIVLGLKGVTFLDSTGLRCILKATARSRSRVGRLRLRRPASSQVRQVLSLTKVERRLNFVD